MNDLTSHIEASIAEKGLFRDGQRILAAVSGGGDSMVLLDLLYRLAAAHRWQLTVAHFNHRLRGASSNADERLVIKTARSLGLPVVTKDGNVKEFAHENGLSVEMAARRLRHDFLAATALKLKIPTVALAHHADDQVELFFLRLLRGAGSEGLAGMKWSNASPASAQVWLARPLLDIPKAELKAYAKASQIAFREDSTNASVDFQRNRVRHELIPLLTEHYQPALSRGVLRVMEVIGAESDFVARAAREWLEGGHKPGFDPLPVALQRRIVHQQLLELHLSPEFDLVEHLRLRPGQWIAVSAERSVMREASGIVQARRSKINTVQFDSRQKEVWLTETEREVAFGGLRICWQIADDNGTTIACKKANIEYFDADKVGAPIRLRRWQPGDRFQPIGTGTARKLQDLFTNLKVPRAERHTRVVAATRQGELFWVEGLRMAEKFKLDRNTVRRLAWSWRRE